MENPISYAKHHKYIMGLLALIVIITTAIGARLINKKTPETQVSSETRVSLISVNDFRRDKSTVFANGVVESLQQAELRSQAAGPVAKVHVQIGQEVTEGQALVSLQNDDISAQLAQAQAILRSQQARLDEMKKGARSEQLKLAETSLKTAEQGLLDTQTTQDAVVTSAYAGLLNSGLTILPYSGNVSTAVLSLGGSYTLGKEGTYTIVLTQGGDKIPYTIHGLETYSGWVTRGTASPIGEGGLYFNISKTGDVYPGETWTITIPNLQSPGYSAAKNGYDAAVKVRTAAINGAKNALAAAQSQYDLLVAGASSDQIKAQEALVEQAAASVQSVTVQLNKTIIRSPINGVVASVPVNYGELVSPGTLVASVVNKNGLQVKAYINDTDLQLVEEGAEVLINENIKGKLTHMSPSIDAQTKNVQIEVAVVDPKGSGLVVGQSASLKISAKHEGGTVYMLPLQSVKVSSSGASVFSLKDDSTLEEIPVKLGAVNGEVVEVVEGLKDGQKIVGTVYELKAGQKVSIE